MSGANRKPNTAPRWAGYLYGTGSCLALWGLASLLGLWPEWLDVIPAIWGIAAGALLWAIGLLIEPKPQLATSMPEPQMPLPLPFEEPAVREALQYRENAQIQLEEEAEDFPVLRPQPVVFASTKPIEFTFDDLARLPTLVQRAIEDRLDPTVTPPLDLETAPIRRGNHYHVRLDGPRYDVRTLRSLN